MRLLLLFSLLLLTSAEIFNTDYIADDPSLENYFITYINGTKVVTPLVRKNLK
jgi:hypothetical protein